MSPPPEKSTSAAARRSRYPIRNQRGVNRMQVPGLVLHLYLLRSGHAVPRRRWTFLSARHPKMLLALAKGGR